PRINFFISLPPQSGARLHPPHAGAPAPWPKRGVRVPAKKVENHRKAVAAISTLAICLSFPAALPRTKCMLFQCLI
ncbi:hypothetical protein, partial [Rhizobium anhuiense]|uniref:hypothetical protein n=1 Tax=Rhizobium anhuiense TaxID=1184720 RepID=UPI001AEC84BB